MSKIDRVEREREAEREAEREPDERKTKIKEN